MTESWNSYAKNKLFLSTKPRYYLFTRGHRRIFTLLLFLIPLFDFRCFSLIDPFIWLGYLCHRPSDAIVLLLLYCKERRRDLIAYNTELISRIGFMPSIKKKPMNFHLKEKSSVNHSIALSSEVTKCCWQGQEGVNLMHAPQTEQSSSM